MGYVGMEVYFDIFGSTEGTVIVGEIQWFLVNNVDPGALVN